LAESPGASVAEASHNNNKVSNDALAEAGSSGALEHFGARHSTTRDCGVTIVMKMPPGFGFSKVKDQTHGQKSEDTLGMRSPASRSHI